MRQAGHSLRTPEESKSRLVSKEELRTKMQCEHCGKQALKTPWPVGWYQGGRSLLRIPENTGIAMACWCSDDCYNAHRLTHPNPYESDIKRKRTELAKAEGK